MAAPKTVATYDLGSATEFDFSFDYLTRAFVQVSVIGAIRQVLVAGTDYRYVTNTRIQLLGSYLPPEWTQLEIRRVTSTQERLVDFQDASILRADDLNLSDLQVLHVAEEAREAATETIGTNNEGHLDARGRRLVNLADPVDLGDVVTRRWYEADVTGVYQNRVATEQARDKAKEWATKATQVETGLESARTYASIAGGHATAAATSVTNAAASAYAANTSAIAASGSASNAQNQAAIAEGYKNAASGSANAASGSATAASASAAGSLTQANRAKTEADRAEASATSVDTAFLRDRANHLGTQDASTITGLGVAATVGVLEGVAPASTSAITPTALLRTSNGLGAALDLRSIQDLVPSRFYGTGVISGLCSWGTGTAHMVIYGGGVDNTGFKAIQQVVHSSEGIHVRVADTGTWWGSWKKLTYANDDWVTAMRSRKWRAVTRVNNTIYKNDTPCDIEVATQTAGGVNGTKSASVQVSTDGVTWVSLIIGSDNSREYPIAAGSCTVPSGHFYRLPDTGAGCWELRSD